MPWPWLIPTAVSAGISALSYASRPKMRPFEETAAGQYLTRLSSEGRFPLATRQKMVGEVGRRTGTQAQIGRSRIRGGLAARGMSGSIAGQRLLAQPGIARMGLMESAAERIDIENELSKARAAEQLAMRSTDREVAGTMMESQAKRGLLTGLGTAGLQTFQDIYVGGQQADFDKQKNTIDMLIQAERFDDAMRLMQDWGWLDEGLLSPQTLSRSNLLPASEPDWSKRW